MKLQSLLWAATTVAAIPAHRSSHAPLTKRAACGPGNLLVGAAGKLCRVTLEGDKFSVGIVHKQKGMGPTSQVFVDSSTFYSVDENGQNLYRFKLGEDRIEPTGSYPSSAGVVSLAFNKDKTRMYGSGYGSGKVDVWNLKALGDAKKDVKPEKVIKFGEPEKSRPHQTVLDPTGEFFVVNDLAANKLFVVNSKNDIVNDYTVETKLCGPRHGVFVGGEKGATHYAVVCEKKNTVIVYETKYGGDKGIEFKEIDAVSTFDKTPFKTEEAAAGDIVLRPHANGKMFDFYVSNRVLTEKVPKNFPDIVQFTFTPESGEIKLASTLVSGGFGARKLFLTSDGKSLLAASMLGEDMLLAVDIDCSGKLGEVRAKLSSNYLEAETTGGWGPSHVMEIPCK